MGDTLFAFAAQEAAAERAKEDGIDRADRHGDPVWKEQAFEALRWVVRMRPTFTSDDIWERLDALEIPRPVERSVMGSITMRGARDGLIVKTGRRVKTRQKQRHRELDEWMAAA